MKTQSKTIRIIPVALLLLVLGMNNAATAQAPPPLMDTARPARGEVLPAPPPPPAPGRPDRPPVPPAAEHPDRGPQAPPEAPRGRLQPVAVFKGTVSRFLVNDDFIYDGFTLKTSSDSFLVRFAPSTGQAVMKILKDGSSVTVTRVARQAPAGGKEIEAVSLVAGGSTIELQPASMPPVPVTPTLVKGSGKINGLGTDREGRVNSLILTDHEILRLPPAGLSGITPSLIVGAAVSYTGTLRSAGSGEAIQANIKVIHCQTITINGQQYLVSRR